MSTLDLPVKTSVALWCLLILALALTALVVPAVIADPFFGGDAAHRMNMAQSPVVRLDNRVWLPTLQAHIWLLYQFQPPPYVFKLIPCLYYLASIVLVGMLAFTQTGRSRLSLVFALALAFCFARQALILSLGMSLMQEIIGLALFFLLLQGGALELRKKWWLLVAAAGALLTRDSFWIYLFVVSLLNWRRILSDRKLLYSFLALWSVPAFWLLMIPVGYLLVDGRYPDFPTEWPLGINKSGNHAVTDLATSSSSLRESLSKTGVIYLVAALVALWATLQVLRATQGKRSSPSDVLGAAFKPFSLVSLVIVYGLVILFDPFQATYGATRMSMPLLDHAIIWAIVLCGEAFARHGAVKAFAMVVILSAMAWPMKLDNLVWVPRDYSQANQVYRQIEADLDLVAPDKKAPVCIIDDYFAGLRRLLPPTLYRKRIMVDSPQPDCTAIFAPSDSEFATVAGLKEYANYVVDGFAYTLWLPQRDR